MFVKGDKIIATKEVFGISKGEIFEVTNVKDNLVEFEKKMEDGRFTSVMTINLMKEYFEKYEEPKKSSPTVPIEYIEYLIDNSDINVQTIYDKCTIVTCKLPNGFVIIESSTCENPESYDEDMEVEVCMDKIFDKVLELEGYVLQNKLYEKEVECPCCCGDCCECPCDEECELDEEECKDECIETDSNCNNCTDYDCPYILY